MNKNTILAFLLILLTISFFSSKLYYEKILNKPHPSSVKPQAIEKKHEVAEDSGFENSGSVYPKFGGQFNVGVAPAWISIESFQFF